MPPVFVQWGRFAPSRLVRTGSAREEECMGGTPMPLEEDGPRRGFVRVGFCGPPAAQRVALVITTLCIFSNKYVRSPCATLIGAACRLMRRGVFPATSIQYTASSILCDRTA